MTNKRKLSDEIEDIRNKKFSKHEELNIKDRLIFLFESILNKGTKEMDHTFIQIIDKFKSLSNEEIIDILAYNNDLVVKVLEIIDISNKK